MPVYNAARFLRETLQSVLSQTFTDFEFIIIDDASTDSSAAILNACDDKRIRVYTNQKNSGVTYSLNRALGLCRGEYIARMDADDLMHPERLERQVRALDLDPGIAVLASRIKLIDENGDECGEWKSDREAKSEGEIRAYMAKTNCIAHPTVMIRKTSLGNLKYREVQRSAEDWDLWLRLLNENKRISKLPEVLLYYRMHAQSVMAQSKGSQVLELRLLRIRHRFLIHAIQKLRLSSLIGLVIYAQIRTIARHCISNLLLPFLRSSYRLLTYNPIQLVREYTLLKQTFSSWTGRKIFLFNYVHEGGAEQVHADVVKALEEDNLIVLITGFSRNKNFLSRFGKVSTVLEIPRLIHHPFTARWARSFIAEKINRLDAGVFFGSNNEVYFEILPMLKTEIRTVYLIHAFHYQENGNLLHRKWLAFYALVDHYLFVSEESRNEFAKLCRACFIPNERLNKLKFVSNAVSRFAEPIVHQKPGVLFVARKSDEKRAHLFYQIAERCRSLDPGIRFTVLGFHDSHKDVNFLGAKTNPEEISAVYAEHDMLVVTSSREGFPMVIMEAMAHGLVVASTPVGDIRNRLQHAPAFITESAEEKQTVEAITDFVIRSVRNKEELLRQRHRSFEFAREHFDLEKFKEAYRRYLSC